MMCCRWLEKAVERSAAERVVFVTRPELRRLPFFSPPGLTVIADNEEIPAFDIWVGLESLPLLTDAHVPFPVGCDRVAAQVNGSAFAGTAIRG